MSDLIRVENLSVNFKTEESIIHAVKNISFSIPKGKTVGLVGESGSGKSVSALSLMRLVPQPPGKITSGKIFLENTNLLSLPSEKMRRLRGKSISMIFQEPMTSLNPVFTVGNQILETLVLHEGLNKKEALKRAVDLMDKVGIPNPQERLKSYPHQLSGGQRQRVMIAMAIACSPHLLIADEPTTALDVTIQKQILELLLDLQKEYGMSILFITHDLGVIADLADEVVVMYKGEIVEKNNTKKLFGEPQHPYTKGLLACRPNLEKNLERLPTIGTFMTKEGKEISIDIQEVFKEKTPVQKTDPAPILLEAKNLVKRFPLKKSFFGKVQSWISAVDNVSLKVAKGSTLGLVGESGCGKTTLGRSLLRLIEPTSGEIIYDGTNVMELSRKELRSLRRKMQIIFQDPYASLNPRMTVQATLMEPMNIHNIGENRKERLDIAKELMLKVGLRPQMLHRYPHEFSGGQRQRICIARALVVKPDFIICDESVSALDVSIQAQILNLLKDLQEEFRLTYIFISHDLAVVKFFADELAVMEKGQIVETASALSIYENPKCEYTKELLNAIPKGIPKGLSGSTFQGYHSS